MPANDRRLPADLLERVERLYNDGRSYAEIERAIGRSPGHTLRLLRSQGTIKPRRRPRQHDDQIARLVKEGHTAAEIAERLRLSRKSVEHIIARLRRTRDDLPPARGHGAWPHAREAAFVAHYSAELPAADVAAFFEIQPQKVKQVASRLRRRGWDIPHRGTSPAIANRPLRQRFQRRRSLTLEQLAAAAGFAYGDQNGAAAIGRLLGLDGAQQQTLPLPAAKRLAAALGLAEDDLEQHTA